MKRAKWYLVLAVSVNLILASPPVHAATVEELERKIEQMQKAHEAQMAELKSQIEDLKKAQAKAAIPTPTAPTPEEAELSPSSPFPGKLTKERAGQPRYLGGLYDKPFLRRFGRNTYVGGYMDLEYRDTEDTGRSFDQKRLIPFIYSDISDSVKFATEIEFEHGGTNNNQSDGEVKVEFATIDYLMSEWANLRGGIVLSPLGKLNLVHDSPIQDLSDRPLVDQFILPTTLSEVGAGFYGSFYPTQMAKVDYEFYAVNGFTGAGNTGSAISGKVNADKGVRSARGSQKSDNNDNLSVIGRVAVSPWLGTEVGGSIHHGAYSNDGTLDLSIYALDWMFQKGPFELLGEYGFAHIDRNESIHTFNAGLTQTSTTLIPGWLQGYYVQGNYHFMPPPFKRWWPKVFQEDSTFTAVSRWEQVDLNGDEASLVGDRDRLTFGLNFRPIEDTVFKLDYQVNDGEIAADDRDAFLASVATYF